MVGRLLCNPVEQALRRLPTEASTHRFLRQHPHVPALSNRTFGLGVLAFLANPTRSDPSSSLRYLAFILGGLLSGSDGWGGLCGGFRRTVANSSLVLFGKAFKAYPISSGRL